MSMEGGAALGSVFDLLLTSVAEAAKKVSAFNPRLNRILSILSSLKPSIGDIETLNITLQRPHHETEAFTARLLEAEQVVDKCCRVSKWNLVRRLHYSNKLANLEASLLKFFQMNAAALHLCETKRISVAVSDLQEKVNEIATMLNNQTESDDDDNVHVNDGSMFTEVCYFGC